MPSQKLFSSSQKIILRRRNRKTPSRFSNFHKFFFKFFFKKLFVGNMCELVCYHYKRERGHINDMTSFSFH